MTRMVSRGRDRKLKDKVQDDAQREHRAFEKLVWLVIINEADGELRVSHLSSELFAKLNCWVDARIAGKEAMDNSSDNVALNDQQLNETGDIYLEELDGGDYELEDYDSKSQASGSKLRTDGF